MKRIILFFVFFLSINAFGGAYSLNCRNSDESVTIGNGSLVIAGKTYAYYNEYSKTRLMGLDLVDFLKEKRLKVVVSSPDVPTDVAQSGVKILKEKSFKDECGNPGTETTYSEAVGVYANDGLTLVNLARIKCTERIITGHCM
ncbi:MAG: hypothetical protein ACXVCP_07545 [Bdellovibrio sp.]